MSAPYFILVLFAVLGMLSCRRSETPKTQTLPSAPPAQAPTPTAPVPTPEMFAKAALDGDLATVKQMLTTTASANETDPDGRTPLMLSAFNGHAEIVACLLDAGAKIDTRDQTGRTALMYACSGSNDSTVALLLKHGAGVNLVDKEEHWTPLMFAAAEGQSDVVRRLLAAGADPTAADIDGEDSVMFARSKGFMELADLIAKAKEQAKATRK